MKKRGHIIVRFIVGMLILGIVLVIFTSISVGMVIFSDFSDDYINFVSSYSESAAEYIDGDSIARYLETGEKDDYYDEIMKYMTSTRQEAHLEALCVFVPVSDGKVYIWNAQNYEEGEEERSLGYKAPYMKRGSMDEKLMIERVLEGDEKEKHHFFETPDRKAYFHSFAPVFNSEGVPVAVCVANTQAFNTLKKAWMFLKHVAVPISVIIIIAMAVVVFSVGRYIVKPIRTLEKAATELVSDIESGREFSADIHTNDEIESLSDAFGRMDKDLRRYIKENEDITAERERMEAELELASNIQNGSLPHNFPPFPDRDEFELYASMKPAKEVGGDFYDFFMKDDDHLALMMADVSGKGVPAALFMMTSRSMIRSVARGYSSPKDILMGVNAAISENNDQGMFVTVWLGILEISTGKLTFADAGHEKTALFRDGIWSFIEKTDHTGVPLGLFENDQLLNMPERCRIVDQEILLKPGDAVFQYTDGATEATDPEERLFGEKQLLEACMSAGDIKPDKLIAHIQGRIEEFVGDAPRFDDITMLGLYYRG